MKKPNKKMEAIMTWLTFINLLLALLLKIIEYF